MAQTSPPDPDRLYNLLPALYRQTDAAQGYPLRALLRLMGNQVELLRADIQQLWNNFFIETCQQWAIPYIGDLVANRALYDLDMAQDATTAESLFPDLTGPNLRPIATIRTRADVAKTIYYRRRKGTAAMLEELAGDVTGWGAHVVQFFELLTWTQHLNHLRLQSTGCADLRSVSDCVKVDGPFDAASHVVDVRAIAQSEGWYNVPNLGFFLWRLESFPLTLVRARAIGGTSWRYTFSPLGNNAPLFAQPRQDAAAALSPELRVPEPIPPSAFFDDLNELPPPDRSLYYGDAGDDPDWSITVYELAVDHDGSIQAGENVLSTSSAFFQPDDVGFPIQVFKPYPNGALLSTTIQSFTDSQHVVLADSAGTIMLNAQVQILRTIPLRQISCKNLEAWQSLPQPPKGIAIDVSYGRLAVGADRPAPAAMYVSYHYGFSAHLGGGPYADFQKWVVPGAAAEQLLAVNASRTLDDAVTVWKANSAANTIIRIADNDTHTLSQTLQLHSVKWLAIQAQPGCRPHVLPTSGTITVDGPAAGSTLTLGGLLIEGGVVVTQDIQKLRILHSTLVPGCSVEQEAVSPPTGPSLDISPGTPGKPLNTKLDVEIAFSITGPLRIPATVDGLWLLDSIVDGGTSEPAIWDDIKPGTNGPRATIERSTILGPSFFRKFDLCSDTIFTDIVSVEQCVDGCLRFSFVPAGSTTPQQYRCQPAYEVAKEIEATKPATPAAAAALTAAIREWLVPSFQTVVYGAPDYCQLRLTAPLQIRTGASDGAEMGAFNCLKQAQRETNLRIRLAEYVPFGRAPGIIYVT